ncbi:MAG: LuxR C-terminal-related transcriptional regulator [Pseudomonadota bacterium]
MLDSLTRLPKRQTIFTISVLIVFGTSAFEIASEFAAGETLSEMADDLVRFGLSATVLSVFACEYWAQQRALGELRIQLDEFKGGLSRLDPRTNEIANQYRAVMQRQFDAWRLTESEQDVVILMLKGLSFREIATLRETREKTVRQQASTVYRKADVSSRNELAAWFFEDLLVPDYG